MLKLLDLFCGAGGCSVGYQRAGFSVTGVDIAPQPRYPYEFHQMDALDFLAKYGDSFDVIHASPPCQAYSKARYINDVDHPELLEATRTALIETGKPWVIENVKGAPMYRTILLCGQSFNLRTYRHRLFESNVDLAQPKHHDHLFKTAKMGRTPKPNEFMHVVGHFTAVKQARIAMGISWMIRPELCQAIPPAYTEFIGKQIIESLSK